MKPWLSTIVLLLAACRPAPPMPLVILENPSTGQRVSFFREIPFKVPADYDESEHIAQWKAARALEGYTTVVQDR